MSCTYNTLCYQKNVIKLIILIIFITLIFRKKLHPIFVRLNSEDSLTENTHLPYFSQQ
jgi:hypothetical protein